MSKFGNAVKNLMIKNMHFHVGNAVKPTSVEVDILMRSDFLEVGEGFIKTHYTIDAPKECNPLGSVHGGVTATLVDSITTMACFVNGEGRPGVTTDLSVSYMKAIDPEKHPEITLIGKIVHGGRKLSYCEAEVRSKDEKILFATGKQTKFMHDYPGPLSGEDLIELRREIEE